MKFEKITLGVLFSSAFLFAKPTYLPPLELNSFASSEVLKFLEEQNGDVATIVKKNAARDILGRIKNVTNKDNEEIYYVFRPQITLDVSISPLRKNREIKPIFGRYEVSKNGEKSYWLNEKKVPEEIYFERVFELRDDFVPEELYHASLTASEINDLMNGSEPVFIDVARKVVPDYYTNYSVIFSYSEITSHAHGNLFKGQGVGVYFDEYGCSDPIGYNSSYFEQLNGCSNGVQMHATAVATTLSRTAPMAKLYANDGSSANNLNNLNMNNHNPSIEISSHSWHYMTNGSYSSYDKTFDNYIYNNRLISFVASGNIKADDTTTLVGSPALALNTIAVGAVNPSNNNYASYSKWRNSNAGNQKPEMANYSEFYFPNVNLGFWDGNFAGTSASTPYTAAIFADLLSQHGFLKRHPEMVKALIVSGEKMPIGNASSYDTDNNSIGAKGMVRYSSLAWNHRFRYWNSNNSCCFDSNDKITFTESGISSGVHYRIAIAWLTSGNYASQHHSVSQDIDLRVWQNGTLLASSISAKNPFEVVDFTTTSSADLTIEIHRFANSGDDNVILGYSLWNDF